jgi:DNA/RNA-binding domain of Phe-tRNA-synthetase-like protein
MAEQVLPVDSAVADLGVRLVAFTISGLDNRDYRPALRDWLEDVPGLRQRLSSTLGDHFDAALQGFRVLRERTGRSWKRFPPSCQSLIDSYHRRGELPVISPAVDCYNALSVASGLSLGAHDLRAVSGGVRLTLSRGGEAFCPLGSEKRQTLPAGDYIYRDDDAVLCRMDYRQARHSVLVPDTTDALFIVQGHDAVPRDYIAGVARELRRCLTP